jgi:hypothetical protein
MMFDGTGECPSQRLRLQSPLFVYREPKGDNPPLREAFLAEKFFLGSGQ